MKDNKIVKKNEDKEDNKDKEKEKLIEEVKNIDNYKLELKKEAKSSELFLLKKKRLLELNRVSNSFHNLDLKKKEIK